MKRFMRNLFGVFLRVVAVVGLVMANSNGNIAAPTSASSISNEESLYLAVEAKFVERFGANIQSKLVINILSESELWAFGIVGIMAEPVEGAAPDSFYFVGQKPDKAWVVALEHSPEFQQGLAQAPDAVVAPNFKTVLALSATPEGDGSAQLSLPWATGTSWYLTGGPHNNSGANARPWSALDFNIGSGQSGAVRAARDGVVARPCNNFVRVDHGGGWQTGYYHLTNIAVSSGQSVARGDLLGYTSAEVGCGGSATGPHTHFSLRLNGTVQEMNNRDIGGWTVQEGSSQYAGCMVKGSTTRCAPSGQIYNDGSIGSGTTPPANRNPSTPTPVSPSDYSVSRNGQAPTLCWSNATDPDGDAVQYYAEVYQSAVNTNSGWITGTCWRPSALDGNYANYQWRVMARDGRGGSSSWSTTWHFSIEAQNLPPAINFQTANGNPASQIYSNAQSWNFVGTASDPENQLSRVELRCTGDNCGSGNTIATGTTAWSLTRSGLAGQNNISFVAIDNVGNTASSRTLDLRIDLSPPTTALYLNNDTNPANWPTWFRGPVALRLQASDGNTGNARSEVRELRYQLDGGAWQTVGGNLASFTVSTDGTHTLNYYATDNVGNTEATRSVTFRLDATPPTPIGGLTELNGVTSGQWQKTVGVPSFGWAASTDPTSGLANYQLYFGFDPTGTAINQVVGPSALRQWTPLPGGARTGTYYLRGRTCDVAGNCTPWATLFTYRYDITAPAAPTNITHLSGIASTVWQSTTAAANFTWPTPADEGSGVQGYHLYWGLAPTGTTSTLITTNSYQSPTPLCSGNTACTGYLRLRSLDNVSNLSDWTTAFVLRYDHAPPVANFVINGGVTQTAQTRLELNLNASDSGSGLWAMRLSGNGQDWTAWEAYTTTRQWDIPGISRQWWPVYLQVQDQVGWVSPIISRSIYLEVNPQQPRSATYRLFDHALSAGAGAYSTTLYTGRGTLGQVFNSPTITSTTYRLFGGYEAGSQALPIIWPGYDTYLFINSIFASGTGGTTLTSTAFSMRGTFGELGIPTGPGVITGSTTIASASYQHQPGFLAAARVPTPIPTPTPGPTPIPPPAPACEFPRLSLNNAAVFTYSPNVTLTLCAPNATQVMLSNDGGFGGAVWEPYVTTRTWTLTAAGAYVLPRFVYAAFKDANGNIYSTYFDDIILDPTQPVGALALSDQPLSGFALQAAHYAAGDVPVFRAGGLRYLTRYGAQPLVPPIPLVSAATGNLDLWLNAQDDNSGLLGEQAGMQLSQDGVFSSTWAVYSAQTTFTPTGPDGLQTLYARVRDGAGNVSDVFTASFILDTFPPIGGLALAGHFVGPATLTRTVYLGAEDNVSGVSDMRLGYLPDLSDAGWQPFTYTWAIPVSLTAQTLYVQFRDFAGNLSEVYSDTYTVDPTPPEFYVQADLNSTLTRTLSLLAYDELTDVGQMRLSNDPQMLMGVVTLPYTPTLTWVFDSSRVVWVQMADSVGNWSATRPFFADAALYTNTTRLYLPFVRK